MTTPEKMPGLGPFLGISNRREDFLLHTKDGDYLKGAENVDITNQGSIKRRRGASKIVSCSDGHSLYGNEFATFYADGPTLYRVKGDDAVAVVSIKQFDGVTPVALPFRRQLSFAHDGINTIFSDGLANWRILSDDRAAPLGPPSPNRVALTTAGTGGALAAGLYTVVITYLDAAGRESEADAYQVEVAAAGTVVISSLPATFPTWVAAIQIYITQPNGDVPFLERQMLAPSTTITIALAPHAGGRCLTRGLDPMPAGDILRFGNGRTWSAKGNIAYYSEPWAVHLNNLGFIPFPHNVTLLEVVPGGTFIGTSTHTYFVGANPEAGEFTTIFPYGAIPRTSGRLPESTGCFWMSTRGLCVGSADGTVKNLQESEIFIDPARVGATMVREQDGLRQYIAGLFDNSAAHTSVGSFMEAV
mgnify:CR=1 FL=1